ncbi:MAG: hypothetical protein FJ009_18170 [Chloroflexi bacterium]|nr:hypothetical protein [Chloroflexota bacterium]
MPTFPNPPKLYLNENLSARLVTQLRRYDFDVTSAREEGLLAADDRRQMEHAVSHQRAIVSFNFDDFTALHEQYRAEGREHWGIILSTEESIGTLVHRLLRLLNSVSADELKNQICWLNEFK